MKPLVFLVFGLLMTANTCAQVSQGRNSGFSAAYLEDLYDIAGEFGLQFDQLGVHFKRSE